MSATRHIDDRDRPELAELPEFELCYRFDDAEEPTEVTIFSPGVDVGTATRWLTADRACTVPLENVR